MTITEQDPPVRTEPAAQRIRVQFNGEYIADSANALHLFERGHTPVYYFPMADVRMDLLEPTDTSTHCPRKGDANYWTIVVGDKRSVDAVWGYATPIPAVAEIAGHVAFYSSRIDAMYADDDEVTGA